MKKVIFLLAILSSFAFGKNMWIYNIKTNLIDPNSNEVVGEIYEGTPVKLIKNQGELSLIEVKGVTSGADERFLVYKNDKNTNTPLSSFLKLNSGVAKNAQKYLVKSSDLVDREYPAWEEIELVYYDTCTSCHAGHHPAEHLMNEWDAYLSAMQYFAKINDEEKARILRFLESHAKDGFAKEEE
ncbi:hypothetical protein F1B92_07305 [Campylobacter sp. FMV-PI01]|uniref:Molybdopterin-containing oxidoreductase I, DMSO/TMAO/BSO reductase family, monoheme c-type cytochrome n=1 Tax=Campylobacter portucalensis TaxID=2608384 RepID=A0A6L5WLS2_9BACT|nr:hypothetical protein [Campylobacter portucalensis]MSN96965.1 hypothetical protein [Campylobacter portucalensis]